MPESIEYILREIAPHLRNELGKLGCFSHSSDVDDLLQEIEVKLWRALENKGYEIKFLNSYAKKVVFSVFINEVNRIRREKQLIGLAENERRAVGESSDEGLGSDDLMKNIVIESLSALSRTKRLVIELRLEGFTLAEIAHLNHWSLGKVRSNYYRGLRELKRRLARRGICNGD